MKGNYCVDFGGQPIHYAFHYSKTIRYFLPFARNSDTDHVDVVASREHIEYYRQHIPESKSDSYVEYKSLIGLTSLALLPFRRCIFHAVAFEWKGLAWLLTGPSGTGKSTQFFHWAHLYPGEVRIISGDMPCLEAQEDGSVLVHPSPWNGKERLKGKTSALLGGIVLLKQDHSNSVQTLTPNDCIRTAFFQCQGRPETEEQIASLSFIVDHMLRSARLCLLSNLGDTASARLCHDYLEERIREA